MADSFLVDSILVSHRDQQHELMSGVDEEGPFIELWLCQDKKAEDKEGELLYSYWLDNQGILTFQKHKANALPDLEQMFGQEAEKLIPLLYERVGHIPQPVRWLYQKENQHA